MDDRSGPGEPSFVRKLGVAFLLAAVSAGAVTMLVLAAAAIVYI